MKTLRISREALAIAGALHAASAHETGLSKQHAACIDKSGGVTMDMIDCITAQTQRQDSRLNKAKPLYTLTLEPHAATISMQPISVRPMDIRRRKRRFTRAL